MMIKYRVHEVAKDLEIPNKDVIDVLKDYTGETKKHMTALTEDELDLVFESFTQKIIWTPWTVTLPREPSRRNRL